MLKMKCVVLLLLSLTLTMPLHATAVSSNTEDLAKANTDFAWNMYDIISQKVGDGNMFFSPLSISLALGMTYAGANGTTQSQMEDILEFEQVTESGGNINLAFQELYDTLNTSKNYTLRIANKIFGRKDFDFLQDYLDLVAEYFRAPLEELDFAGDSSGSRTHINDWVADQTNQKIKNLIPPGSINAQTALVLVNAIYFKAYWFLPFDPEDTDSKDFHAIDGEVEEMDMMLAENYFNYAEVPALNSKILELPYAGSEVSMFILLPNDRQGLQDLEEKLQDETVNLDTIERDLYRKKVRVTLPKFKMTQDISLSALLEEMGMKELFCSQHADLSKMNGMRDLYVTEVAHKAYIDVNEEGTEAAGATGIIIFLSAVQFVPEFTADHPFIFYIKEKVTGSVLFVGRLTSSPEDTMPVGAFGLRAAESAASFMLSSFISLILSFVILLIVKTLIF